MKKVCTLFIIICFPFLVNAQFSKKEGSPAASKDTIASTLDLKLHLSSDTAKARIIVFAKGDSDQFLSWIEGYLVAKTYKLPNGQVATAVGNLAYTLNWQLIKPEDIYDVKVVDQKNNNQSKK